jgi:hypothetical protein
VEIDGTVFGERHRQEIMTVVSRISRVGTTRPLGCAPSIPPALACSVQALSAVGSRVAVARVRPYGVGHRCRSGARRAPSSRSDVRPREPQGRRCRRVFVLWSRSAPRGLVPPVGCRDVSRDRRSTPLESHVRPSPGCQRPHRRAARARRPAGSEKSMHWPCGLIRRPSPAAVRLALQRRFSARHELELATLAGHERQLGRAVR